MMKNLLIIGARGFGREVFATATESAGYKEEFIVKGFLDDHKGALDGLSGYPPIIDSVENYQPCSEDLFITALGDVQAKKKYSNIILDKGGEFYSLIHKDVFIRSTSSIGKGCLIMRNAAISCNVKVGDYVSLMANSIIGHDVTIGNGSHLGPFVFMGGRSETEAGAQLHARATILPDIHIGKNAVIGAGSVVMKNVEEYTTVFGNPAKKIYNRKPKNEPLK